jgi:hypothetical protein
MSTYLELVQELVSELGIGGANQGGTVPDTVVNQTGQLWNAANWIKQANNNINVMWADWQYLAVEYSEALTVGSTTAPAHSGSETVKKWDRGSFWIDQTLNSAGQLSWFLWEDFRRHVLPGPTGSNSKPSAITQKRDGTLLVNVPPDASYTLTAEFYKRPALLATDTDEPEMPEEFHRIIVCEAAIKYGNKEAAAEVISGMEAEYAYLLDKLQTDQLNSQDLPVVIDVPGYDEPELGGPYRRV